MMAARTMSKVENELEAILGPRLHRDEPMARHTTIGVGGKARYFAEPSSSVQVIAIIRLASGSGLPYVVIGRGSNLLVRDGGFDGLVIKLAGNFSRIRMSKTTVSAQAGASLSHLARRTVESGRRGLEFAVGIPGSVGGAVWMNAGAYGREIASVLSRVRVVTATGRAMTLSGEGADFQYRTSNLAAGTTVLTVGFRCPAGNVDEELLSHSNRRQDTQPLGYRSFGCTFVNPPGQHAGKLIEGCGLKGRRIGGAVISDKHANFILNVGPDTTAKDIEALIELARSQVRKRFGVELKQEVVIIGHR